MNGQATYTNIRWIGSRWSGDDPASIDELLELLAREPLDPSFERYGNFIEVDPRVGIQTEHGVWEDGELLFPEHPGLVHFHGNFAHVSHVFCIDTTDPDLIQRLTAAIRANQESEAYRAYKALPPGRFFAAKASGA